LKPYTARPPASFVDGPCDPPSVLDGSVSRDAPFMPAPSNVDIRRIALTDTGPVQRLWSDRFGGASSTQQNWIEAALTPTHSAVGFVATAPTSGPIVGLSFLDVGDRPYTHQYLGLDTLDCSLRLPDRTGIFHLSCVRVDWEGYGIGSAFYEQRLAVLRDRGIPRAVGIAWNRPHTVDSRVLFEKYAFTCLATVERYYARTGERPHCPDCDGSCTCSASLYARPTGSA
jgi:GNAT superfamily N-acetyltransferase